MSALDRMATIGRAVRLVGLALVLFVVVASSWAVARQQLEVQPASTAASRARTFGDSPYRHFAPQRDVTVSNTVSNARQMITDEQLFKRFAPPRSSWPANCKIPVLVIDMRDWNGDDDGTVFIYPTLGFDGAFGIKSSVTFKPHMECADNWPRHGIDTRSGLVNANDSNRRVL